MRFVKYSLKEYGRTVDYVAFGDDKFWMPIYQVLPNGLGLEALEVQDREDMPPEPVTYPAVMKFVDPVRKTRKRNLPLSTILRKYGPVFDQWRNERDTVLTRQSDAERAEMEWSIKNAERGLIP